MQQSYLMEILGLVVTMEKERMGGREGRGTRRVTPGEPSATTGGLRIRARKNQLGET